MIYQPRNVRPSNSAIDGSKDNTFTMEVQTNSYISAYQLLIVDFDNNNIYTGTKTILPTYLYNGDFLSVPVQASEVKLSNGSNYKWRVRLYQPTSDMLITYGLVQKESTTTNIYLQKNINIKSGMTITINSQTQTISSYDIDTGLAIVSTAFSEVPAVGSQYQIYSDFIETVPDYIVYARQTPTVTINNIPATLTLKYHTFEGVYTQSDNVPIVYHQFDLYMQGEDGTTSLINTSGKGYSANLSYTYDGFRTGNTYLIKLTVENDMGIIVETNPYSFTVSYDIVEYLQQPKASFNSRQNAIDISWVTPVEHDGISSSGEFRYLYNTPYNGVNSLYTDGYKVDWQTEDGLCVLPDNFNITLQFSPDGNFFYDENGIYQERVILVDTTVDSSDNAGKFQIIIDKNKLIFTQEPNLSLEKNFYVDKTQMFVLTESGVAQINGDYIWDDTATWNDNYIWTEGGTSIERICNHWWKVQITNTFIEIEEIFPT